MEIVKQDSRTDAERLEGIKAAAVDMYIAIRMLLEADDNRSAIVATEACKAALRKATLGTCVVTTNKEVKKALKKKSV